MLQLAPTASSIDVINSTREAKLAILQIVKTILEPQEFMIEFIVNKIQIVP